MRAIVQIKLQQAEEQSTNWQQRQAQAQQILEQAVRQCIVWDAQAALCRELLAEYDKVDVDMEQES